MRHFIRFFTIIFLFVLSSEVNGQINFTNDGGDKLFSNAANWAGGVVPTAADKIKLDTNGDTIIVDGVYNVRQILATKVKGAIIGNGGSDTLYVNGNAINGVAIGQPIQANGNDARVAFHLPVVLKTTAGATNKAFATNGLRSHIKFFDVFINNSGHLTLSNPNNKANTQFHFDGKYLSNKWLNINANSQVTFGENSDFTEHKSAVRFIGNAGNGHLTVKSAKDKFKTAGTKVIVNTGGTLVADTEDVLKTTLQIDTDKTLNLTVNANQSNGGKITMVTGKINLTVKNTVTNLDFPDNSAADWGTGTIDVTGFKNGVVSFGTTASGITSGQLAQITTDGLGTLSIDEGGNLNTLDLFFSEYAEGSSNNKYLEIYNPTSASVSLDGYALASVSNAPSTVGVHEYWKAFATGATIASGDVYIVAHGDAAQNILDEADETYNYLSNGDDGFGLAKGTEESHTIIDWVGDFDGRPSSGWEVAGIAKATQNRTLIRKSSVAAGNTSWAATVGTDADDSEWIVKNTDYHDDLGKHTYKPGYIPPPTVQFTSATVAACEGDGTATLIVSITDPSATAATTVDVALTTGTASAISDYTTQTLTFAAGSSKADTVTITIPDDSDIESAETFVFTLQNVSTGGAIGDDTTATLTVSDNDYVYNAAGPNLFFSEYAEGSSSNKYLEIYNPTSETVSLDNYAFVNTSGASSGSYEYWTNFASGATIAAGATYVVAHSSANETIKAAADETRTLYHNGDDVQALVIGSECGYTILDIIGDFYEDGAANDPGDGWTVAGVADATKDHTLVRKASATTGNANWTQSAGTNADDSEWMVKDQDDFSNVGKHKYGVSNTAVQFSPTSSTRCEGDQVDTLVVSITDPSATVATTVEVALTSGNASDLGDYTTQTLTFAAGSSQVQHIIVTFSDDTEVGSTDTYVFTLQNVAGGESAEISEDSTYTLNIQDNDVEAGTVDLFFSEYAEGSSYNKYLEIYNPTSQEVSLDGYAYANTSNGSDGTYEYWNNFPSGAVIAAGATYVIAHKDADQSILDKANEITTLYHNGDDGQALMKGTECGYIVLDRVGDFGEDPGAGWEVAGVANATQDHTLIRKASVATGNNDWAAAAGTTADDSEWIVKDQDDFADVGSHTYVPDSDGDGVTDDVDQCPDTPSGASVDANGCADSQKDADGDGVSDDIDQCADTPSGASVDANGCADSQKDTDGDGVTDDLDQCAGTPSGATVDATGCELPLFVEKVSFINRIYPNPASEILKVELDNSMVLNKYVINDLDGKIIEAVNIGRQLEYLEIDVKSFNEGLFILHLDFDKGNTKVKFLKE